MPSYSLLRWQTDRVPRLNALDVQAAAVPPSVFADENLRALVAMLSAHFQGFCRDLYIEAAEAFIRALPAHLIDVAGVQCSAQIALGTGNPNLASLSRDFERFDLALKPALDADPANALRLNHLALLNQWRNFVVHHGVNPPPSPPLDLPAVRAWFTSCDGLASELDRVVYDHMRGLLGALPW